MALAGVGGASAAAAEELALFGSVGTATAAAILTAVVGEVFETYVAASARTRAYQRAGRSPDPDVVLTDLAEAAGYATSVGRRATPAMARDAAGWLSDLMLRRTAVRFSRALVPLAGVAIGAGMSMFNVRRVSRLALRPPAPDEVIRLAEDIVSDRHAYDEARQRYLELPEPPSWGRLEQDEVATVRHRLPGRPRPPGPRRRRRAGTPTTLVSMRTPSSSSTRAIA